MIKAAPGPLGQVIRLMTSRSRTISTEWFGTSRARSAVIHAILQMAIEDSTPGRHDAYSSARPAVRCASEKGTPKGAKFALVALTPRKTALFEVPIPDMG